MPETSLNSMRRVLRDERGLALPLALGVMVVLSSLAAGIFTYVTMNQGAAKRATADQRAYGLAETGLSYAFATLQNAANPLNSGSVPSTTVTVSGGTVTYSGSLSGTTWTLTGTGSALNPSGPGAANVVRTVSSQAQVVTDAAQPVWSWNFSDSLTTCTTIPNGTTFSAPFYIRGDLCLSNGARFTGTRLHVGGTNRISNLTASVGTLATPITSANIVGGCRVGGGAIQPCSSATNVFAGSVTNIPDTLTKPPVDLDYWYQNASPGPQNPCTSGSVPGGFDNDTTRNSSRPTFNLTPGAAYSCSTASGQISWTPGVAGAPGSLVVAGTIFFDGDIQMTANTSAVYTGKATIYASGRVTLANNTQLCGIAGCTASWDPNINNIMLVAGRAASPGFTLSAGTVYQGSAYVVSRYDNSAGGINWGPVIANELTFGADNQQTVSPNALPPGAPGTLPPFVRPLTGTYSG